MVMWPKVSLPWTRRAHAAVMAELDMTTPEVSDNATSETEGSVLATPSTLSSPVRLQRLRRKYVTTPDPSEDEQEVAASVPPPVLQAIMDNPNHHHVEVQDGRDLVHKINLKHLYRVMGERATATDVHTVIGIPFIRDVAKIDDNLVERIVKRKAPRAKTFYRSGRRVHAGRLRP